MPEATYNIVRRAYSQRAIVEVVDGFVAANLRAMALQAERQDGEYSAVAVEHGTQYPEPVVCQSTLAIAWV